MIGKLFRAGKDRAQPIGAEFSGKELPKKKKKKKKETAENDPLKTLKKKG